MLQGMEPAEMQAAAALLGAIWSRPPHHECERCDGSGYTLEETVVPVNLIGPSGEQVDQMLVQRTARCQCCDGLGFHLHAAASRN
jgi:hypothetical protein